MKTRKVRNVARRLMGMATLALVLSASVSAMGDDRPLYRLRVNENNADGTSGFTNALNWCLASDSSQIATEAPNAANDYLIRNGYTLRTPEPKVAGAAYSFNGNSLQAGVVNGEMGNILLRSAAYPTDITFANEGAIFNRGWCGSWNNKNVNVRGKITVNAKATDPYEMFVSGGNGGTMNIYASILGSGHLWVHTRLVSGSQASTDLRCTFRKDSLKDFTGTVNTYWCQYSNRGGKSVDDYSQTFLAEDGEFPGHLHIWPGSAYEGLSPSNIFTVGKLTLDDDVIVRVSVNDACTTASLVRVTDTLTAPGRLFLEQMGAPSRTQLITDTASGAYTFPYDRLPIFHVENGASALAAAFNHDRTLPVFPSYEATTDPDGTVFIEPEFHKVVRMTGSSDGWKNNSFTGTGKDSPSTWCDGNAPTDQDCAYIVSGKDIRSEYSSTGMVASFLGGALVFMNTVLFENCSGCVNFPDLRVISAKATIANIGEAGYSDRFADFPSFVTKKPFAYTGRIRMSAEYSDSKRLGFCCYSSKAMDISAEISGIGRLYLYANPQSGGTQDSFVGLFGMNTNFTGQVYLSSGNNTVDRNRLHFYFRDVRSLGGPRPVWRYDAFKIDRESTVYPLADMTLDTKNMGIHCGSSAKSNFNTFNITNGVTFACKCRFTRGSIVRKTGKGTFALGGPHPYYGSDGNTTPTATSNRFEICEGALKPLSSEAFQGLELVMSNGTEIVYDVPASTTDGDIGQYGMRNTEWATPFVLPEGGVTVRFEDAAGYAEAGNGRIREVALATVADAATADAVEGRLNLRGFTMATGRSLSASLQRRTNGDGSVTLYAKLVQGFVLSIR